MIIEAIADYACETGEGPLWHPDEDRLYWADIPPGKLYRYDPATGTHGLVLDAGEAIGGFTIQEDGALLLFMARGRIALWREGQPLKNLVDDIPAEREGRFNDVIADPAGRVFCGTMPRNGSNGVLYRLDTDGSLTVVIEDAGTSNGMGFTQDLKTFYHTNTRRGITRYDYDIDSGQITNPEFAVREGASSNGRPDGMTMTRPTASVAAGRIRLRPSHAQRPRFSGYLSRAKVSAPPRRPDYTDLCTSPRRWKYQRERRAQAGTLYGTLGVMGKPPFPLKNSNYRRRSPAPTYGAFVDLSGGSALRLPY